MIAGGSKCVFAGGEQGPCSGRIQWHHVYPKARLKKQFKHGALRDQISELGEQCWFPADRWDPAQDDYGVTLEKILADPRNRMWLCSEGHHEPVTNHRLHPSVPESVWEFCRDFGLTADLENDLRRAA